MPGAKAPTGNSAFAIAIRGSSIDLPTSCFAARWNFIA